MPVLHPLVVHFPIALLIVSVLLDAAGVLLRRASLTQAGFACLVIGSTGAAAATLTGPTNNATSAAAFALLRWHTAFATVTVAACLIMVGMRLGNAEGLRGAGVSGYLALGALLIVALALTGYFGGRMVYEQGVGVAGAQGTPAGVIGRDVSQMWARLGGIALLLVIAVYPIARFRWLRSHYAAWRTATRAGTPPEHPRLWTLSRVQHDNDDRSLQKH